MNRRVLQAALILSSLLLAGCLATAPVRPPDWVLETPAPAGGEVFFSSTATDPEGDPERARIEAADGIILQLHRYLGLVAPEIEGDTAGKELELFERRLAGVLLGTPGGEDSGFRLVDSYSERRPGGAVEVSLLAAAAEETLVREKERFSAISGGFGAMALRREQEGDGHRAEGRHYAALRAYLKAAVAAGYLPANERGIIVPRLLERAAECLEQIRIQPLSPVMEGVAGRSFPRPFEARIVELSTGRPVADAALTASYELIDAAGKSVMLDVPLSSDGDGRISFTPQAPRREGRGTLAIYLDLRGELESIYRQLEGTDAADNLERLEVQAASVRAVFPYQVVSAARRTPTGIILADFDTSGNPIGRGDTAEGVLNFLKNDEFLVERLDGSELSLAGAAAVDIAAQTAAAFDNRYQRLIYGTAHISDFSEKEGKYYVTVRGRVEVIEIPSGKLLFGAAEFEKSVIGNNLQSTISAAFRQLGKGIGSEISLRLP